MLLAIEGLPGAGKTTSAGLVAGLLAAEAVCETTQDHPFLDTVYDDDHRYDLEVELAFLLLHAGAYRRVDRRRLVVADYSPVKDVLFARDMLDGADLRLWTGVYDHIYSELSPPDLVVFLRLPPEECLKRIRGRGREFEVGLTIDRLERMEALYEGGLADLGERVLTIDLEPEQGPDEVADAVVELLDRSSAAR